MAASIHINSSALTGLPWLAIIMDGLFVTHQHITWPKLTLVPSIPTYLGMTLLLLSGLLIIRALSRAAIVLSSIMRVLLVNIVLAFASKVV